MASTEQRQKLHDYLMRKYSPEFQASQGASDYSDAEGAAKNALASSLMKSAAQVGTLGGKQTDTSPVTDMANNLNSAMESYRSRTDKREADREKLYSYLADKEEKKEIADRGEKQPYEDENGNKRVGRMVNGKLIKSPDDPVTEHKKAEKPEKVTYSSFEYTDSKGNKRLGRMASNGTRLMDESDPLKETASAGDKPSGKIAENFEGDYAKKTQIASVIDAELEKFNALVAAGDEDGAAKQGKGMLKALNSAFGADAVGAQEAESLGGFLDPIKKPWAEGSMFSRDLDKFAEQVKNKSDVLKKAARDSYARAQKARSEGMAGLGGMDAESMVTTKKTVPSGTALADDGYVAMKNKKTGETLQVRREDMADAEKDGFSEVK